jgi:Fe-S-cluster containining protein
MGDIVAKAKPRSYYDCVACPAYCCSVYERVQVTLRDLRRLAKHFGVDEEVAKARYTKMYSGERVLRRKKDHLFGMACQFINPETRGCTIYHARPAVCREFPTSTRCAYYDLLQFEKVQQDDPDTLPLVKITFRNGK